MASTGYQTPTATGGHNNTWTNPSNAQVGDGVFATVVDNNAFNIQSYENFNFSIPSGATINGIEALITAKSSTALTSSISPDFYSTSAGGFSGANTIDTTTSNTIYHVGGSANLWNKTWVDTDFSNANFYLRIYNRSQNTGYTISVDEIQVQVYYTEAPTTSTSSSISTSSTSHSTSSTSQSTSTSNSTSISTSSTSASSTSTSVSYTTSTSSSVSTSSSMSTSTSTTTAIDILSVPRFSIRPQPAVLKRIKLRTL